MNYPIYKPTKQLFHDIVNYCKKIHQVEFNLHQSWKWLKKKQKVERTKFCAVKKTRIFLILRSVCVSHACYWTNKDFFISRKVYIWFWPKINIFIYFLQIEKQNRYKMSYFIRITYRKKLVNLSTFIDFL